MLSGQSPESAAADGSRRMTFDKMDSQPAPRDFTGIKLERHAVGAEYIQPVQEKFDSIKLKPEYHCNTPAFETKGLNVFNPYKIIDYFNSI